MHPSLDESSGRTEKLSAVIITRDEADKLGACLRALDGWVDEIVVVDSGSTDGTVEIARTFTPRVIDSHWRGFGRQKQFAVEAASHEWILSLDADEVVSSDLRSEIDRVLTGDSAVSAYRIPRELMAFGVCLRHGDPGHAPLRLFRRDRARFSFDRVHESVITAHRVKTLRSRLKHYGYRGLEHTLARSRTYASLWAQQRFEAGRRATFLTCLLHGAWSFVHTLVFRGGWLDGRPGFIMAALHAQYTYNKYAILWSRPREIMPKPADGGLAPR